ncbi:MAG: hypothetical protein U0746_01870 [Gemmataceae bacterium]
MSITVRSQAGETESAFKARLSAFWTHMLRNFPDDFERVYAETTAFESDDECLTRQYLVEAEVGDRLEREFATAGISHDPIDRDDVYSKYEATPPEWMWIEH